MLGISWNTQTDTLSIKPVTVPKFAQLTKRRALSICSQVYDPLGLLTPVTVKSKVFLQELWKDKKEWDEPLDSGTIDKFNGLFSEYGQLDQLRFPRAVSSKADACSFTCSVMPAPKHMELWPICAITIKLIYLRVGAR